METKIYIVRGQVLNYEHRYDDEPFNYDFNIATYATEELAQNGLTKELDKKISMINGKYELRRGKTYATIEWNEGKNIIRYAVETITFES